MKWEELRGDGTERFCEKCQHAVTDLSQMTEAEADDFLAKARMSGKRVCAKIVRRPDGSIVTKDCPKVVAKKRRMRTVAGAVLAASGGVALSSCASQKEEEIPLLGIICEPQDRK